MITKSDEMVCVFNMLNNILFMNKVIKITRDNLSNKKVLHLHSTIKTYT
jgi:hypothetical protein